MAIKATQGRNAANTIQVDTMTEGTAVLDISGRIVIWPVLRVGVVSSVTVLTGVIAKADIEARVVARPADLAMAGLAVCQVCFGVLAVASLSFSLEITAIQRMRNITRSVSMTTSAVEAGRVATGYRLATTQVLTVATGTGGESIRCGISAVIAVGVRPT